MAKLMIIRRNPGRAHTFTDDGTLALVLIPF